MKRTAIAMLALGAGACGASTPAAPGGASGAMGSGVASAGGNGGSSLSSGGTAWGAAAGGGVGGTSVAASGSGGSAIAGGDAGRGGDGGGGSMSGAGGTKPGEALTACQLSFPYREQGERGYWLGADSNFSVALSGSRALMTFQDTFVGGSELTSRSGSAMVGNSVANISCEAGQYAIDYHWGGEGKQHGALFDEGRADERLWIHRPWFFEGKLFLTATRVTSDDQGFDEHGITLARVNNPLEAPEAWSIEYFNLTDQRLTVGKGIFEASEHVYLFTPDQNDLLLARIAKSRLLEPSISEASLEYLKSDGTWAPGLVPGSAKRLGIAANTGLTVRYHEASSRWLALFTDTSGWPSARISVSSAAALEGPWSRPTEVYSVPEMKLGSPEYEFETICYGASEHVLFNPHPDTELLFTYTCNSLSFSKLLGNMAIYVPRIVKRPLPALP